MNKMVVYTEQNCRKCAKLRQELEDKGFQFTEVDISSDVFCKREMIERTGGRKTAPQILLNGRVVNSLEDLLKKVN